MRRLYGANPPADQFPRLKHEIEAIQKDLAFELLEVGIDVIWDYGVWTRKERETIKKELDVRSLRAIIYKMVCDWNVAVSRVSERSRQQPKTALAIDEAMMSEFKNRFEEVTEDEGFELKEIDANQHVYTTPGSDSHENLL